MEIEEMASKIMAVAMKVHTALGPGLLETACQKCMEYELRKEGLSVECEYRYQSFMKRLKLMQGIG